MKKGTCKVVLALVGIFLAGGVAGGFGGVAWERHRMMKRFDAGSFVEGSLLRFEEELRLTSEQMDRIRPIMVNFAEQMRTARRKAFAEIVQMRNDIDARIEAVLTPGQLVQFREMQRRDRERWDKVIRRRAPHPGKPAFERPPGPPPPPLDEEDQRAFPPPPPISSHS